MQAPFKRAVAHAQAMVEASPPSSRFAADLAEAETALAVSTKKRAEAKKDDDAIYARNAEKYRIKQMERIAATCAQAIALVATFPHPDDAEGWARREAETGEDQESACLDARVDLQPNRVQTTGEHLRRPVRRRAPAGLKPEARP